MIILTKNNNHASKQGAVISLKHWRSQTMPTQKRTNG